MEKQLIKDINTKHIHAVDKHYRMYSGLSSQLLDYVDNTIILEITINERWQKDSNTTAKQLADSWKKFNPELSSALHYLVHVIHSKKTTGFVLNFEELKNKKLISDLIRKFNDVVNPSESIIETIEGDFEIPSYILPIKNADSHYKEKAKKEIRKTLQKKSKQGIIDLYNLLTELTSEEEKQQETFIECLGDVFLELFRSSPIYFKLKMTIRGKNKLKLIGENWEFIV